MKIFASILSVYILVLAAIPCIDVPKDNSLQNIEFSNSPSDHHENEGDHCSPFCTCDCCVSPALHHNLSIQFKSIEVSENIYPKYHSAFISILFFSIWQPPQLG
jgi:hypothetical protein